MKTLPPLVFGFILTWAALGSPDATATPVHATPIQVSIWNPVQLAPEDWDVWGVRLNLPYGKNEHVYGVDAGVVNFTTDGGVAVQAGAVANICVEGRMIGAQISPLLNVSSNFVGIQAGFVNGVVGSGNAIQVGFVNFMGNGNGLQIGVANGLTDNGVAVQAGIINFSQKDMAGLQIGGIGCAVEGQMTGLQFGSALFGGNGAGTMNGIQIGFAILPTAGKSPYDMHSFCNNYADELNGVQIGLWCNRAKTARGLQLALVNIADKMTGVQIGLANIIKDSPVQFLPVINAHF